MSDEPKQLIKLADLLKENHADKRGQAIAPVINPFLAFVLYIVAVHYFCFSLWPLVYWKICVYFNLLDRLTGREFLNIASKVSFSTGLMMFFFFFSAGYNTTKTGATQQYSEPFPTYRRLVKILNNSGRLTFLIWLMFYVLIVCLFQNGDTKYYNGTPLPNLETIKASQAFPDFSSYCKVFLDDVDMICFPFYFGSVWASSGLYVLVMSFFLLDNRFPFFIFIEPFNLHFWQKIKPAINYLMGRR